MINPESAKVLREMAPEESDDLGDVKIVNPQFEAFRKKAFKGEKFVPKQNLDLLKKVKEIRERLSKAEEGFVEVKTPHQGDEHGS